MIQSELTKMALVPNKGIKKYITVVRNKELHFLFFGFIINLFWEIVQMPLFTSYQEATFLGINTACIQASAGDAVMIVVSFWILAILFKSREWIYQLNTFRIGLFLIPGLVFTIIAEHLAIGPLGRWEYGNLMPVLPFFGTGVVPIIQWMVIPALVLWVVRKSYPPILNGGHQ